MQADHDLWPQVRSWCCLAAAAVVVFAVRWVPEQARGFNRRGRTCILAQIGAQRSRAQSQTPGEMGESLGPHRFLQTANIKSNSCSISEVRELRVHDMVAEACVMRILTMPCHAVAMSFMIFICPDMPCQLNCQGRFLWVCFDVPGVKSRHGHVWRTPHRRMGGPRNIVSVCVCVCLNLHPEVAKWSHLVFIFRRLCFSHFLYLCLSLSLSFLPLCDCDFHWRCARKKTFMFVSNRWR